MHIPRWPILVLLALVLISATRAASTGKLTVRVLDAETGEPLPARLVLKASDGTYPGDRLALKASQWPNLEAHGVFTRGEQTFDLPAGRMEITAAHGLDYQAESSSTEIAPGQTRNVELKLHRVVDMRKLGWVSGDMHVHMIHGEQQRQTSYEDVATTCAGNGLDFVYVCQEWVGAGKLDLKGYEAECEKVSTPRFRMFLGAERPQSLLGHQVLLGVRNPFVIPEDPPFHEAHALVHAQGGCAIYVHPTRYYPGRQYQGRWLDFPGNNLARELIFDAFCGPSFDGISVLSDEPDNPEGQALWFNLLNRGLAVPAFADSDACFDRPTISYKAPGFWSTYLYVGPDGKVTHDTLATAVRKGQTFATTGPLLQFQIEGQISGATLPLDGKERKVHLQAWLPQHAFTLEKTRIGRVELIRNGAVAKSWEPHVGTFEVTDTITEKQPSWYALRVYGEDRRWQVAVASPIYFDDHPRSAKQAPLAVTVRGRIYDFKNGKDRAGEVEVADANGSIKRFQGFGKFQVRMPIDATITAGGVRHDLLTDYGPVHRFLWYLESKDLARPETFDQFQKLVENVELEFPVGYRMMGSYVVDELMQAAPLDSIRVVDGPARISGGTAAVAAVLMDAQSIRAGDTLNVAAIFRDEGDTSKLGPLVVEARGYDPARPSAFNELKKFAEFEKTWGTARDLGNGYRLVSGSLKLPEWVRPGPSGGIDISVRARQGNGDASFVGFHVPLGSTRRALSVSTAWPTMPVSWPDRNYGIGPFKICNRIGHSGQPRSDYRQLRLEVKAGGKTYDLLPARDGRGCPDADDAVYTGQYVDQVLADVSHLAQPDPVRAQPKIVWPANLPIIDCTRH